MAIVARAGRRKNDERVRGEQRDDPAHESERRVVEELEEHAHRAERQHHRGEDKHQEIAPQRELLREQEREQEADDELQRNAADHDRRGVAEANPDFRVGENVAVIREAGEHRRRDAIRLVLEEAQAERPKQRKNIDHEEGNYRGGDQERPAPLGTQEPADKTNRFARASLLLR